MKQLLQLARFTVICLMVAIASATVWADEETARARGESIYREQCSSCHGMKGEGTEDYYPMPLAGDMAIGELANVIAETMPEEDPEACVGDDAAAVASYLHYAFYSEAAQIRNRPPRVTLARLTASQLRQSLADLYARFDGVAAVSEEKGLQGQYFEGRRGRDENRKIQRVDPALDFDFGHEGPGEEINPEEFYIHWSGGLKVDVTGRYEIVVHSSCSFVLQFGARERELINNHVQSGDKTEFRRTLVLTAGRVYPIHIDFTQRKRLTDQPPARFSLSWIPPHGVEEVIPARNLTSVTPPPTFSLQAKLPPDDRSYGYERGISVNRQWDESTTEAAIEFARFATEELWPGYLRQHRRDSDEDRERLRSFLATLVETAFRAPLTSDLRESYVDRPVDAEANDGEAIKRSLLMTLKSPRFLYPTLDLQASDSQRVANRLALTLYDSLPADQWLLEQAEKDRLTDQAAIRKAAERMVNDYRLRGKIRGMMVQWLDLGHLDEITKDSERYPGFDEPLVSDLRHSLDAMIDDLVWSESSDFRQLFQADWVYTTDRLATFYGDDWKPADDDQGPRLRRSIAAPERRFGILNHPLLMSGLSYHADTSPIHRGVFLVRSMLGRTLRPPNEAFSPLSPDLHPELTTRERTGLQTSPESCQACHLKINSLGFTLENFDAVGRYRSEEGGRPVDPSGSYRTRDDEEVLFGGPGDLASYLAESDDSHRAFVGQAFEFLVKQPVAAFGHDQLERLTRSFRESDFSIRDLLIEIAVVVATATLEEET